MAGRVPPLSAAATEVPGPVPEPAPTGALTLRFAAGPHGTRLRHQAGTAPLRCLRAFDLGGGEAIAQVIHVGPGVMAGDRLALTLEAEPGAQAVVVAQSATKLHAMLDGAHAEQHVHVRVGAGASLEWHPGLTIPFARSAFRQRVEVDLEPGARFVLVERWARGRVARGERHAYRWVESRLQVRVAGRLAYADALVLDPDVADLPGVFDAHAYLATGVAFGVTDAPGDEAAGGTAEEAEHAPSAGTDLATLALRGDRVALRGLGHDGVALQRAVTRRVDAWRAHEGRACVTWARYGS